MDPKVPAPAVAPLSRPQLPIIPHFTTRITERERDRIAKLARRLLAAEPALVDSAPFGVGVSAGLGPWASLILEDHSWIDLFQSRGDAAYSYRALLLAQEGDIALIGTGRDQDFEAYFREVLDLGKVEVLAPSALQSRTSLTARCLDDLELLDDLVRFAQHQGGLNLVAYMGTGGAWQLAGRIAELSGVDVQVAAPLPRLTRRVNDKVWFAEQVIQLFGKRALPATFAAFGLSAAAGRLAALAKTHASVALKLAHSASSEGNFVFDAAEILDLSLGKLRQRLEEMLIGAGWRGDFPLLITAWETPLLASPSVQAWIPRPNEGDVIIEGVFDQKVRGMARIFSGAVPSRLPTFLQQEIAQKGAQIGLLFQDLGYFGRCSFDAILVGENPAAAALHWVECNGRWGGLRFP